MYVDNSLELNIINTCCLLMCHKLDYIQVNIYNILHRNLQHRSVYLIQRGLIYVCLYIQY